MANLPRRDPDHVLQLPAQGLGAVQRAAAPDQPEPGAVRAARHDVRRRRQTNFALPDLRARTPIHIGNGHTLGERGGEQAHTLSIARDADARPHCRTASTAATGERRPDQRRLPRARTTSTTRRRSLTTMNPDDVANVGGSQAHQNMQPYLTLTFCIALQGIFPSRN